MRISTNRAVMSVLFAGLVAILLPACAGLGREMTEESDDVDGVEQVSLEGDDEERVFVGNVSMVNVRSRFVLIKTPVNQRLKQGIPLQSFDEVGMTAELLFSPEQTVGFMTADISQGAPKVGDQVYLRYTEDFRNSASPRMQQALNQHQREQNMSFFEKKKYQREKKRQAKAAKKRRDAAAR